MPLTTAASIYRDWILGDAELKTYWTDQIDWVDGHEDDFPDQTKVEVVAEMLGDALAQDITGLEAHTSDESYNGAALMIRLLEEAAANIDYEDLAEGLIDSLGATPDTGF
jgi:hypothetical protein